MTDGVSEERHDALVRARCALSIVHAQYFRALHLAQTSEGRRDRSEALAEARRLVGIAVALRCRAEALQAEELKIAESPERRAPESRRRLARAGRTADPRAAQRRDARTTRQGRFRRGS